MRRRYHTRIIRAILFICQCTKNPAGQDTASLRLIYTLTTTKKITVSVDRSILNALSLNVKLSSRPLWRPCVWRMRPSSCSALCGFVKGFSVCVLRLMAALSLRPAGLLCARVCVCVCEIILGDWLPSRSGTFRWRPSGAQWWTCLSPSEVIPMSVISCITCCCQTGKCSERWWILGIWRKRDDTVWPVFSASQKRSRNVRSR